MTERGGGNRPPRRMLGDYAYQQGPKHYNSIVIPPFSNKVVELKPTLLSLIGSHPFAGMDHEDPYTHFSTFMELCSTMGASDEDVEVVYLRAFPFSLVAGGTVMSKSPEEAIVIIDSIAASDYQSHHDRAPTQRKGWTDVIKDVLYLTMFLCSMLSPGLLNPDVSCMFSLILIKHRPQISLVGLVEASFMMMNQAILMMPKAQVIDSRLIQDIQIKHQESNP
ncbi:hypothetical protein D0Y65_038808 [Glycine soja]|uniref:Uncharacterized protein n=1 Tax=Glycine soja TaxID=3848 RepID=A0A445H694_GLYSO|nr:hypothetical protein D0Y65_038808 [Glycine soja]